MIDNNRLKIALLLEDDLVWVLRIWDKVLPVLQKEFEVVFICVHPNYWGKHRGIQIPLWYLKTFGFYVTFLLVLFAVRVRISMLFSGMLNWDSLAAKYGVRIFKLESINDPAAAQELKENKIDIAWVMSGEILKKEVLYAPKLGCLNKHGGILPSCRGILPYFWGVLENAPKGMTVHTMEEEVDSGRIVFQEEIKTDADESMVSFYSKVFDRLKVVVPEAIRKLSEGKFIEPRKDIKMSIHSFPKRDDYLNFKKANGKVITFKDIIRG